MGTMDNVKCYTVLAVDDERLNTQLLGRVFRGRKKFRLLCAESAEDGLSLLRASNIDVLLADQSMPDMSGVEFVRRSKAMSPTAICIMVTGYPELAEVLEARDSGLIHHIIAKPWEGTDVLRAIEVGLTLKDLRELTAKLNERPRSIQ